MSEKPRIVFVPEGITIAQASDAIQVCVKLGLVQRNSGGYDLLPQLAMTKLNGAGKIMPRPKDESVENENENENEDVFNGDP